MGKGTMVIILSLALAGALFVAAESATVEEISCTDAIEMLMPCQQYLKSKSPEQPPVLCCEAAGEVYKRADTKACRQNICECYKKAAIDLGVNPDRAKQLPDLCHLSISIPIDPNVKCGGITR